MLINVLAPLLGALFISLALITFSSNINPYLHSFMNEHLKQIQENLPLEFLREIPIQHFVKVFSSYLFLSGIFLYFSQGLKRLLSLIFLSIFSIYMIQLIIIAGLSMSNVPIYIAVLFCLLTVLFNDCTQLEDLQIK